MEGPERDEAMRTVSRILATMDKVDRAHYRNKLAKILGFGVREFNDLAKAGGKEKDEQAEATPTLGGWIDGWLVDYVYDPASDASRLAFRDPSGKVGIANELTIEGTRYVPKEPTGFVQGRGDHLPERPGELEGGQGADGDHRGVHQRQLPVREQVHGEDHQLLRADDLGVRLVRGAALPAGDGGGGGREERADAADRVLCYRTMSASGANTTASFFRAIEMFRGTVFIDESDLHDGGRYENDFVKLLNLGAMKGNPIWRLEEVFRPDGSKGYEPVCNQVFGPKLIAMRKEMRDDAAGQPVADDPAEAEGADGAEGEGDKAVRGRGFPGEGGGDPEHAAAVAAAHLAAVDRGERRT